MSFCSWYSIIHRPLLSTLYTIIDLLILCKVIRVLNTVSISMQHPWHVYMYVELEYPGLCIIKPGRETSPNHVIWALHTIQKSFIRFRRPAKTNTRTCVYKVYILYEAKDQPKAACNVLLVFYDTVIRMHDLVREEWLCNIGRADSLSNELTL